MTSWAEQVGKDTKGLFKSFETNGFPKAVSYKEKIVALATKNIKRMPIYSSAMKYKDSKANLKPGKPRTNCHATELRALLIFMIIYSESAWPSL